MLLSDPLSQFSRHTPRLLRRQLILQLTDQFLGRENFGGDKQVKSCVPSIQRFHGAVLHIKISGISALSLSSNSEDVKSQINEYFSKLLEIVEKHGGDVAKFTGDALFVAWESIADSGENQEELSKAAVSKAAACGQEVSSGCGHHKIELSCNSGVSIRGGGGSRSSTPNSRSQTTSPGPNTPQHSWSDHATPSPGRTTRFPSLHVSPQDEASSHVLRARSDGEEVVFLEVRMAISAGLMAGIDVGSDNRWEYFLIGEPLSKVAEAAEGAAASGEVVLCADSHALLHPTAGAAKISRMLTRVKTALFRVGESAKSGVRQPLSCGCSQLSGGLCVLAAAPAAPQEKVKPKKVRQVGSGNSVRQMVTDDLSTSAATAVQQLLEGVRADVEDAFHGHRAEFAREFTRLQCSLRLLGDGQEGSDERLLPAFSKWVQTCLAEDAARHTHPVLRPVDHTFAEVDRAGAYLRTVEDLFNGIGNKVSPTSASVVSGSSISKSLSTSWEATTTALSSASSAASSGGGAMTTPARLGGPPRLWSPSTSRTASPLTLPPVVVSGGTPMTTPRRLDAVSSDSTVEPVSLMGESASTPVLVKPVPRSAAGSPAPASIRSRAATPDVVALPALGRSATSSPFVRDVESPVECCTPVLSRAASRDGDAGDNRRAPSPSPLTFTSHLHKAATVGVGAGETSIRRTVLTSIRSKESSSVLLRSSLANSSGTSRSFSSPGEIRAVTVLSIKIDLPEVELLVDSTRRQRATGWHFLGRTVNEKCADHMILGRFQSTLEAVIEILTRFGGQLKHFVADGKVALCVGTFGLKGSVTDDNAAVALEAAHEIGENLRLQGIHSSIGVTLGRAYCGPLGSAVRQEYSVLGSSVSLSAALMQQAPAGGVFCDAETRQRDKTHGFLTLDEAPVSGFSRSVETFVPIFPDATAALEEVVTPTTHLSRSESHHEGSHSAAVKSGAAHSIEAALILRQLMRTNDASIGGAAGDQSRVPLHGRDKEWADLMTHLFSPLITRASSSTNSSAAKLSPKHRESVEPVFDHLLPSRCAGVTGSFGIGKSSLVSSIVERLAVVARCNEGCNVHLFKARLDNLRHDTPFSAWKPIIVAMLTRLYRESDAPKRKQRKSFVVGTTLASLELTRSVDHVMSLLPVELQHLRPLFGFMKVLHRDDSVHDASMTLAQKTTQSIELLLAVIQLYVSTTHSLAVFALDNVHSIDKPSQRLLVEVCTAAQGVVVLYAGRTSAAHSTAVQELSASLNRTNSFLAVELAELSKDATTAVVHDVFTQRRSVNRPDAALCDKVFESSGGNPFYAYEIAKSASEHQNQTWDASLTAVHSIRVEEVICHRFDQLRGSAQSLLKMAAVACSNGAAVTLQLLNTLDDAELLLDQDKSQSSVSDYSTAAAADDNRAELARVLHHILTRESFLRVVGEPEEGVTVEEILEGKLKFEFAIPLEQSTIFGLLMEDQKHAIHEYVAAYLDQVHSGRAVVSAEDLQEEAHHWQGACVFGRAMTCYFRAYQAEGDAERRSGWLSRAYSIYLHRKENTELVPDPVGISMNHLSSLFDNTFHPDGRTRSQDSNFASVLTLDRVFHIFEGDSDQLATGVEVLLAVADERTSRFEDTHKTQLLLEDAMQYVLLTKQPVLLSSVYVSTMVHKITSGEPRSPVTRGEMHFHLHSFWPLCFRVLSAYVLNDAQSSHVSVEYFRKVGFVAAQSIALSRTVQRHNLIHALCVECLVFFKMGDAKKAAGVVEELHSMYTSEAHSALLIDTYGYDIVPYVFATAASDLLLSHSEACLVESLVQQSMNFVRHSTCAASVAHCLLPLIAHLSYRCRYLDAYEALTAFDKLAKRDGSRVDELLPRRVIQLYFEWLSKRIAVGMSSIGPKGTPKGTPKSGRKGRTTPLIPTKELEELLLSDLIKKDTFGSGILGHHQHEIELVLADLWVLRASDASADAAKCSHSCGVHLAHVLRNKARGVAQHFFNKASAVKIALDMLSKAPEDSKADCLAELRRVFSVSAVSDLTMEAHQSHLEALCEDLGRLQRLLYPK